MGTIHPSSHARIAGKRPSDVVRLTVWLREPHFLPHEETVLRSLGCRNLIQTSRLATLDLPVESVPAWRSCRPSWKCGEPEAAEADLRGDPGWYGIRGGEQRARPQASPRRGAFTRGKSGRDLRMQDIALARPFALVAKPGGPEQRIIPADARPTACRKTSACLTIAARAKAQAATGIGTTFTPLASAVLQSRVPDWSLAAARLVIGGMNDSAEAGQQQQGGPTARGRNRLGLRRRVGGALTVPRRQRPGAAARDGRPRRCGRIGLLLGQKLRIERPTGRQGGIFHPLRHSCRFHPHLVGKEPEDEVCGPRRRRRVGGAVDSSAARSRRRGPPPWRRSVRRQGGRRPWAFGRPSRRGRPPESLARRRRRRRSASARRRERSRRR